MSSNFERLHEIINEAYAENFSCLYHWEPKKRNMWASISENPVPLYYVLLENGPSSVVVF